MRCFEKFKSNDKHKVIARYKRDMLKRWEEMPPHFLTSAETGEGKEEILSYIAGINETLDY